MSKLPIGEAFDEVYRKGMWKQGRSVSGLGSEGELAERYIQFVRQYAIENGLRSVVDAGCGDFSVGSHLVESFDRYIACDVSPVILEINRQKYRELTLRGVTFEVLDLTSQTLPKADLILIRQVFQHLTNAQIRQILNNLDASEWQRVLITEDVHSPRSNNRPNLDLPCHTVRTRVALGSGVFIDEPPFGLPARRLAILEEKGASAEATSGLVIFELSRN